MNAPNCTACKRKLRPPTSVPRWNAASIELHRKFYEEQKAQRQKEIEEGRFGLYGESQFCGPACAAAFGRMAAFLLKDGNIECSPMILQAIERALAPWVDSRKK